MNDTDHTDALVLPDGTRYEGRLQYNDDGQPIVVMAECGACGFRWNDALITSVTPVPSGRCPNERDALHGFDTEHEREAYKLGVEAAKAAASWVIDGNTSQEHIRRMVAWMDDGDLRADDYLPAYPDLSGEWADAPSPTSLYGDIIGYTEHGGIDDPDGETTAALCDAWEQGVSDTFHFECERILRGALSDDA